jgi:exosortase
MSVQVEGSTKRLFLFGLLCLASIVIWRESLASTFAIAYGHNEYTHILIILPMSCALIALKYRSGNADIRPRIGTASAVFLLSIVAVAYARRFIVTPDLRLSANMVGAVLWWAGAFVLCFPVQSLRAMLFPLCTLLWVVPLPSIALSPIVSMLQNGSASAATILFSVANIPILRNGALLSIPGLTVEVAKECSSIRSSLMLLVTSIVLAELFLQSFKLKVLFVVVTIPVSIAKNGLRIFVLSLLATRVDPGFLHGRLHQQGGFVFFTLALGLMLLFLRALARVDNPEVLTVSSISESLSYKADADE